MSTSNYIFASGSADALAHDDGRRLFVIGQQGRLATWEAIRAFALAGNATFTLKSVKTGERFTYKVRKAPVETDEQKVRQARWGDSWFVSLLRGADNENDYAYMGVIDKGGFHATAKSRVGPEAKSHKAFAWFVRRMEAGCKAQSDVDNGLEVWHEGRCGKCGRKLTVPESVARGLGADCAARSSGHFRISTSL